MPPLSSAKSLQDLPAEGRRGRHLRMLQLPANAELLVVLCLKDGRLKSLPSFPPLVPALTAWLTRGIDCQTCKDCAWIEDFLFWP